MKIIIEKFKKLFSLTHYFKKNNNLNLLTKMQYIITENNKGMKNI